MTQSINHLRDQFEVSMAKGADWETRLDLCRDLVLWYMSKAGNRTAGNGAMTTAILKGLGYRVTDKKSCSWFRPLSAAITTLSHKEEFADMILLGREIKTGKNRYSRVRLWRNPTDSAFHDATPEPEAEPAPEKSVDKATYSRDPAPGHMRVECPCCGGQGAVYIERS